ncbi:type II toxin-antitoxin system RelE/ParE family toxin [Campylobacter concisus]
MQQTPYLSKDFLSQLDAILDFYSKDSIETARAFYSELVERLKNISYMPYRFRKNKTINREDTRDLIFKGYVVVFRIEQDYIKILAIYKHNLTPYS